LNRVTSLLADPRRPGTVRVEVNGARFGVVPVELVAAEGLVVGRALSEDGAARLSAAADIEAAYRAVLDALQRRAYARGDLARRLVRRGHARPAVEIALDRAQGLGLLDDAAYALHYVQTRAARGRGPSRLRRDLLARGVDRALIDGVLAAELPNGGDEEVPLALATKRAAELGSLPRQVKRRRLLAYLARRGFDGHEAMVVVAKAVP